MLDAFSEEQGYGDEQEEEEEVSQLDFMVEIEPENPPEAPATPLETARIDATESLHGYWYNTPNYYWRFANSLVDIPLPNLRIYLTSG